jgi:hypothetical protein
MKLGSGILKTCAGIAIGTAGLAAITAATLPVGSAHAATYLLDGKDTIVFRDGKILTGKIVSETETSVKFKGEVSGIAFEAEYQKSDILSMKRGTDAAPGGKPATPAKPETKPDPKSDAAKDAKKDAGKSDSAAEAANRVYYADLNGEFGVDISATPMIRALRDAKANNANVIIFRLSNKWGTEMDEIQNQETADDETIIEDVFGVVGIYDKVFVEELPKIYPERPRIVFWVNQAMGGCSMLPFTSSEIYMTSEGRLGGMGYLFATVAGARDKVVQQKLMSARLGHLEGMANKGGYSPQIIRAMCSYEYVLSYKMDGGKPVYIEKIADPTKGEVLLTDSGRDIEADTMQQRVRGEGNDFLTLRAKLAEDLGISKGTADDFQSLLSRMDILNNHTKVESKSARISSDWAAELDTARRTIRRLWQEYGEVEVQAPGGYDERTRARGERRAKVEGMIAQLRRYEESLGGWMRQNRIPPIPMLQQILDRIRLEQAADRR